MTILDLAAKRLKTVKVLGFACFTVIDGKSVTKPFDLVYPLCSISLGVFICYTAMIHRLEFATASSEIANYGNFVIFVSSIFVSIFSMVINFIFRHQIWGIFLTLYEAESMV